MKTIVRKDSGENSKEYLQGLAKAEGIEACAGIGSAETLGTF